MALNICQSRAKRRTCQKFWKDGSLKMSKKKSGKLAKYEIYWKIYVDNVKNLKILLMSNIWKM